MWGWVELAYRAFCFLTATSRPDTASTNRLSITLGVMDTETNANTCSSCRFWNTLDRGQVYLCGINNDCSKPTRAPYLDWLSRTCIPPIWALVHIAIVRTLSVAKTWFQPPRSTVKYGTKPSIWPSDQDRYFAESPTGTRLQF
jgi:hypothetical protein